jgi:hypothetical protein
MLAPFHGVKLATEGPADADRMGTRDVALQHFTLRQIDPTRCLLEGLNDKLLLKARK